ncbi:uncharacterized protein LOC104583343 [Brachypodium distachyon]|uniref:WRKY domain-containing protein n=1 Tax=Brachypodium distachyon TaxID=15368 RepID=A0A0Q3GIY3_BRADI|nr:uncharacterized protein LOC104583343 [Brachypodium distachyon]KQK10349.1 hypothetical protein BRADI_2g53497v3 [Brachypodium distachyon]|eukprot:XP_010233535.1 uncharacterized protein LOC104583343 [Brachypodium distachyon]
MALGQLEAVEQLRQELNGGQELSARLWELISHPLDSGGREAALEMIKQISRVFMVSLFMLKPGDSSRVGEARMVAPEVTTERSIRRRSLTKDKRIWYYYKCMFSHQRGCRAKKRVRQQDSSAGEGRPIFQVTYVNEHTCQGVPLRHENTITATNNPTRNAGYAGSFAPPNHGAGFGNDALVSCLAMVLGGASAPNSSSSSSSFLPPCVQASMSDPAAAYVPDGGHSYPSLQLEYFSMGLDDEMATETKETSFFSCGSPFPFTPIAEEASGSAPVPSLLPSPPVEAISSDPAAGGEYWASLDQMTEMNFSCGTLFPPVEEARSMGYSDGMSRGSWTQIHQEQPEYFPSELPPAASSSSFSSVAWPSFDVNERWG